MTTIQPAGKAAIFIGAVLIAVFGYREAVSRGIVPRPNALKTLIPLKANIATEDVLTVSNITAAPLPSNDPVRLGNPQMRGDIWEWNAMFGMLEAIGGACTTKGSFMERHQVNVCVTRQDDTTQMQNDLVTFANALHGGDANPKAGVHFVVIMGDGAGQFLQAINPQLAKLGKEYQAEIIGAVGYSRGEDKLMGPPAWLQNPKLALGKTVAGVIRDGDWNIAMKWARDNELPNNPDDKLYDPKAINWINAADYNDAAQKYVAAFQDSERPIKGALGKKFAPTVDAVVTWFPGDQTVAQGRGGLVSILSTKENAWQMPAVVIGIKKWFSDNRQETEGFLAAAFQGADQVKTNPAAFQKAAEISAQVYKDKNAAYWASGFCGSGSNGSVACKGKGAPVPDKQGLPVEIGGSAVSNLADNLQMIDRHILEASYTSFGNIAHQQYPRIIPAFPVFSEAFDPSFVQGVARMAPSEANPINAERTQYASAGSIKQSYGKSSWHITFRSGSADIDPRSDETLQELYNNLVIQRLNIVLDGYTDSTGNPESNLHLSADRAQSVKAWLQSHSAIDFPDARFQIHGFGQGNPIASNATDSGRAQNRRVEITVGTAGTQ